MNYRLIDNNNSMFNVLWQILSNTYVESVQNNNPQSYMEAFDGGAPVFNTLVWGESLNWGPRNLALKKLEESLYRTLLV